MVTHDPSLTPRTTRNLIIADGLIVGDSRQSKTLAADTRASVLNQTSQIT